MLHLLPSLLLSLFITTPGFCLTWYPLSPPPHLPLLHHLHPLPLLHSSPLHLPGLARVAPPPVQILASGLTIEVVSSPLVCSRRAQVGATPYLGRGRNKAFLVFAENSQSKCQEMFLVFFILPEISGLCFKHLTCNSKTSLEWRAIPALAATCPNKRQDSLAPSKLYSSPGW